jgi:hypothetical protein
MLCLTVSSYVFSCFNVELEGAGDKLLNGGVLKVSSGGTLAVKNIT